jgi:hypothetical protein
MKRVKYSAIVEVEDDVDLEELKLHLDGGISFIEDEGHNMEDCVDFRTIGTNTSEMEE